MVEQTRLLQAEIRSGLTAIEEVYRQLATLGTQATGSQSS